MRRIADGSRIAHFYAPKRAISRDRIAAAFAEAELDEPASQGVALHRGGQDAEKKKVIGWDKKVRICGDDVAAYEADGNIWTPLGRDFWNEYEISFRL